MSTTRARASIPYPARRLPIRYGPATPGHAPCGHPPSRVATGRAAARNLDHRKEDPMATDRARPRSAGSARERMPSRERRPYTFVLDAGLVERARREVGELDVVRSIEAALAAAIRSAEHTAGLQSREKRVL